MRENTADGTSFTMLVDCGDISIHADGEAPSGQYCDACSRRISAADFLKKEKIKRLDLLVITHLHRDHVGGLLQLLAEADVSQLWCNYVPDPVLWGRQVQVPDSFSDGAKCLLDSINIYSRGLLLLSKKGAVIRCIRSDQKALRMGRELHVFPFCDDAALPRQEKIWQRCFDAQVGCEELDCLNKFINDTSLRLRICYAGRNIELPGDFCAARWDKCDQPECSIVKLPHHGHADSLTEPLAAKLRAEYTVVSVSNSRTDHCPAEEIMAMSGRNSGRLLFTDAVTLPGIHPVYHDSVRFRIDKSGSVSLVE